MRAITKGLPRQPKKEGHFAAMPYSRVPAFVPRLRERESYSRLALELVILTAARSGELRHAEFDEFDLSAGLWTIPAQKMKAGREHVVPLCARAVRIIERCAELRIRNCPLVFPGMRGFKPMSDMTLTKLLRELKEPYTVHGFRSAFRDWVSEEANRPSDVAEAALAHVVKDMTEAAYRRGNLLEKRRLLMAVQATLQDGRYRNFHFVEVIDGEAVRRDYSGHRLIRVPRLAVRAVPALELMNGRLRAEVTGEYCSRRFGDIANAQDARLPVGRRQHPGGPVRSGQPARACDQSHQYAGPDRRQSAQRGVRRRIASGRIFLCPPRIRANRQAGSRDRVLDLAEVDPRFAAICAATPS